MFLRIGYAFIISLFFVFGIESAQKKIEKVYVSPEDIHITDRGIYWYDCAGITLVDAVFFDNQGLYIIKKPSEVTDKCINGHRIWCWNCLGCAIPICKFRCKCVEWPFHNNPYEIIQE